MTIVPVHNIMLVPNTTMYLRTDVYEAMDRVVLVPVGSLSPSPGVSARGSPICDCSTAPTASLLSW